LAYRIAVLCADALILIMAQDIGWNLSYGVMAALMLIGITATIMIREPAAAEQVMAAKKALWTPQGLFDAVIGPFVEFFKSYGLVGLVMLLMITLYRLPDFLMGPMAPPFYHDLGFQKAFVGTIRGTAGLAGSIVGVIIGGLLAAWLGYVRGLIVGAVLQGLAIASFSLLAFYGGDPTLFGVVMFCDNAGVGAAGVLLVTYMSSLTTLGYTATQYALLSSAYTWVGKILKGFSGVAVETLSHGRTLMEGYGLYFIGCGLTGVLALVICLLLIRIQPQPPAVADAAPNGAS
jgi:PAT family beta-lactamase induction signal transducer AmpG